MNDSIENEWNFKYLLILQDTLIKEECTRWMGQDLGRQPQCCIYSYLSRKSSEVVHVCSWSKNTPSRHGLSIMERVCSVSDCARLKEQKPSISPFRAAAQWLLPQARLNCQLSGEGKYDFAPPQPKGWATIDKGDAGCNWQLSCFEETDRPPYCPSPCNI